MCHKLLRKQYLRIKLYFARRRIDSFSRKYGYEYESWLQNVNREYGVHCHKCGTDLSYYYLPVRNCDGLTVMGRVLQNLFDSRDAIKAELLSLGFNPGPFPVHNAKNNPPSGSEGRR